MDSKRSHLLEAIVLRYLRHWTLVKIFVLEQSDTKVILHEQKEAKWSHKKAPLLPTTQFERVFNKDIDILADLDYILQKFAKY